MAKIVEVSTGSRLHFGMFSFGHPEVRQFGGVGVMIDSPRVEVRITSASQLTVEGPMHPRAADVARSLDADVTCKIEILSTPRQHVGLGTGTQLALAVARGLHALLDQPCDSAEQLARLAGRGRRSAIGVHGFWRGGLIMEAGKLRNEISPLVSRVELPGEWRWLVAYPHETSGLSGAAEEAAFERLPPVPPALTEKLRREAVTSLLPAAARGGFDEFSRGLYRFGQLAGECFLPVQAGVYATRQTAELVETIRREGIEGVGQSSWGPAVFALARDAGQAQALADKLIGYETIIAATMNGSARMTINTGSGSSRSSRPRGSPGP